MEPSENRCALQGMEERLFKMVSNGATPTLWSKWLQPPLEQAVAEGDLDLVLALLKAGADASAGWRGGCGRTLLQLAAEGGNEKIVYALLKAGGRADFSAESRENSMPALYRAIVGGHTAAARVLLVAGAGVDWRDKNKCTALHLAVMQGDRELVEYVLIARTRVDTQNSDGDTPLHLAAAQGDCAIISMLLRAGADKFVSNMKKRHALHEAVKRGHIDAAETLLKAGADPNVDFGPLSLPSPLTFAINGSSAMTRLLLQYGASLDACDYSGLTPLHRASAQGCDSGVIDALIEAGATVEARCPMFKGRTPLHLAAAYHHICPDMDALLRHGADIHAEDSDGCRPLHLVCAHLCGELSVQAADCLLRQGADETATDHDGNTAEDLIGESSACAERLKRLLASAPADRAWRRRALLVLCRAFPDRLQPGGSEGDVAKVLCRGEGIRTDADGAGHGRREYERGVLQLVVRVEAEAVFRHIVGFL